jgi:exocyst complex protein 7
VVNTTITSLVTLSRSQRRPTFGSIFLLNNVSYLRTHLLTNGPDALLSSQGRELLNSNFRTAKAKYMDANLSPLLAALGEDKDKSKSSVKEKFTRFFDLLDELVERHAIAEVLPDESEVDERERVCQEVVPLVVSLFQGFVQKNPGKDFSRSKSSALHPQDNVDHRRSYSQTRRNVSSHIFL